MKLGTKALTRVALLVGVAFTLSACFYPLARHHQNVDPDTRPWWCHSHEMDHGNGHGHHPVYDDVEKGMLSWDDCLELSAHLQSALEYAQQWPTRGAAEADGWSASVNYAAGMGTHHHRGDPLSGEFDPGQPKFLQYGGNGPDAELVGMSWYVNNGPDEPPAGFPGNNDWWHTHENLCFSNSSGLVIRDGPCLPGQNGTTVYLGDYWMLHAWIVPGWQLNADVFENHHPCLLPGGPADDDHMCWEMTKPPSNGHMDM